MFKVWRRLTAMEQDHTTHASKPYVYIECEPTKMFNIFTEPDETLFRICAVKTWQSLFVPLARNAYTWTCLVALCHLHATLLQWNSHNFLTGEKLNSIAGLKGICSLYKPRLNWKAKGIPGNTFKIYKIHEHFSVCSSDINMCNEHITDISPRQHGYISAASLSPGSRVI